MKVYLRIAHDGEFYNQNCSDAFAGCNKLGLDVVRYKAIYSINDNQPEDLVVGSYSDTCFALDRMGIHPEPLDPRMDLAVTSLSSRARTLNVSTVR